MNGQFEACCVAESKSLWTERLSWESVSWLLMYLREWLARLLFQVHAPDFQSRKKVIKFDKWVLMVGKS